MGITETLTCEHSQSPLSEICILQFAGTHLRAAVLDPTSVDN